MFRGLDPASVQMISRKLRWHRYEKDDLVFRQGETTIPLSIIRRGSLRLERRLGVDCTVLLDQRNEGDVVDELGFVSQNPALADAIANETLEVWMLPPAEMQRLLTKHSEITLWLLRRLAHRLQSYTDAVGSLRSLDAEARLARELLASLPQEDLNAVRAKVRLIGSQEEIAHLIGTRRETVNRCLRQMKADQVLVETGRNVFDADLRALYRIAGHAVVAAS